jgi:RNA polymerase-binding protein DksA
MAQQQLSQEQLLHFKTTLRERSEALRADIRSTLERSADETHVRVAEQARDMEDDSFSNLIVDLNLSEVERDVDELRRISTALRRAADGTYGLCEDCDVVIPTARLEAEPTAGRCVRCQELYEKTHAVASTPSL